MVALRHVLVATDFSSLSDAALTYGRALARRFGASLYLLHVSEHAFLRPTAADSKVFTDAAWRALEQRRHDRDRRDLSAHVVMEVSDDPAEAIVAYARAAHMDVVVLGAHGHDAVSRLLVGSVAERVIRTAPCPVLTVRHPEHAPIPTQDVDGIGCSTGMH